MTIINIYNDTPKGENAIINRAQRTANIIRPHPTILTGDFNMHHPLWSREDREASQEQIVDDVVEWTAQLGLTLLNTKGEITHLARHSGERPSVIDLSFTNYEATSQGTIKDWAIDPQLSLDSDHSAIKFSIDQGRTEIENIFRIKFNVKDIKPEEWVKTFEEELEKEKATLDELKNMVHPSQAQLDLFAETLSKTIRLSLEKTAKPRKISPQSKPWWDDDLKNAANSVNAARREHQEYQQLFGEYSPQIQAKICRSRNFFKRLCKHKKRTWLDKILEEARIKDIWKFQNWSKGIRNYPTPPISQGPDLPKATTHRDKCEALWKELYQIPPDLGPQPPLDLTTPAEDNI